MGMYRKEECERNAVRQEGISEEARETLNSVTQHQKEMGLNASWDFSNMQYSSSAKAFSLVWWKRARGRASEEMDRVAASD